MYHVIEEIFKQVIQYSTILMELAGMLIVLATGAKCFCGVLKHREGVRTELAEGISLALLFKMGGEVLRTVLARDWNELAILGAVIALRGALTVLLHWEIKNERQEGRLAPDVRTKHE